MEDTKSPSFLHLKKLSRDYWISITGAHPVKIHVWDFCGGSCESFNTLVHCDLTPPVGATSRGTARMTSSSKLSREAFWQTDWMQSLNSEGFFFFQRQKERKGMRCVRESVTAEWRHSNGLSVSITYVKIKPKWDGFSESMHDGAPPEPTKGSEKLQNKWLTIKQDLPK